MEMGGGGRCDCEGHVQLLEVVNDERKREMVFGLDDYRSFRS